tara:strand:- start:7223 stop:8389 length:1167 start_codon:yes stop_codon:yes gene_type:complete
MPKKIYKDATKVTHSGRVPHDHYGFVNTPVYRGSTILANSSKSFREKDLRYFYGSQSNPTTEALENSIMELDNADSCKITSSGRTAILLALLSFVSNGDHIILSDNVYDPTRQIANNFLTKMGVQVSYFDPLDLETLKNTIRKNTVAIFFESPGSLTFEIVDIRKLMKIAKENNIYTIMDNTWATPLFFKPYDFGVDVSVHAGTKYIVGHSDSLIGAVTSIGEASFLINDTYNLLRVSSNADDAYLASRGLRTMKIRMEKQLESALKICENLYKTANIREILYPPFEKSRGHKLWLRDFKQGGASLMSIVINNNNDLKELDKFIDSLKLFGIGASWGGYESLVMPVNPNRTKTGEWGNIKNSIVRLHIGLEDPDDLIEDLNNALKRLD